MKKEARKKALMKKKKYSREMAKKDSKEGLKKLAKVTIMAPKEKMPEAMKIADKLMQARKDMDGDDYACGGKKYEDGGIKLGKKGAPSDGPNNLAERLKEKKEYEEDQEEGQDYAKGGVCKKKKRKK